MTSGMITTIPEHLKPMVEKAAADVFIIPNMARLENFLIAFLNACLEDRVAVEAEGYEYSKGWFAHHSFRMDNHGGDFPALILSLGAAK